MGRGRGRRAECAAPSPPHPSVQVRPAPGLAPHSSSCACSSPVSLSTNMQTHVDRRLLGGITRTLIPLTLTAARLAVAERPISDDVLEPAVLDGHADVGVSGDVEREGLAEVAAG